MHGIPRRLPFLHVFAALVVLSAALLGPAAAPESAAAAGLSPWNGGINLYRSGVFTTQKTWQWCTAADVQIIRNIVDRDNDHSRANQQRYFSAMRAHNRYAIPAADGVDPAGWTYGLRHYVDTRYRLVSSGSFNSALRSAVSSLRRTNLPVGITVGHGGHAWVLTGFTATADPAKTTRFTVTSVRVTGPLWGLQSRSYGYDMKPNTKLTPKQLAGFFTPWHYARIRMAWEGRWVSIQPIGKLPTTAAATPKPTPRPTATPTARPSATPAPSATATLGPSPSVSAPSTSAPPSAPGAVANAGPDGSSAAGGAERPAAVGDVGPASEPNPGWIAAAGLLVLVVAIGARLAAASRRHRPGSATR
jgi:hypothetical protein